MKTLVVYSSRTGNTRLVAEAIHSIMPARAELVPVEEAPDPAGYDFLVLGFWVNRGELDAGMLAYMDRVKGSNVGLFCTLGTWPDSKRARKSIQKAVNLLEGNNVLGSFICQGKVSLSPLESMAKMLDDTHPMTEERRATLKEAARHPNKADCKAARVFFDGIVQHLAASSGT